VVVEVEFDSDNNPLQLRPHEVDHVVVVVRGVDYYHRLLETRKVVVAVDNFVVDYYIHVAGYCALAVGGIVDVVVVDGLVDCPHRVISGESGRFGSLAPCWAISCSTRVRRDSKTLKADSSSPTDVISLCRYMLRINAENAEYHYLQIPHIPRITATQ
jgi:hypothetical protein